MTIIDSSVLLAVLQREPGWESVAIGLPGSVMSTVNFSEAVAKLVDKGSSIEGLREAGLGLGIALIDFDEEQAIAAGMLRSATRRRGLSLGDRACLALAIVEGAQVLTADRAWAGLELGVDIEVIR